MKELVKVLMLQPELLSSVDPEHIDDAEDFHIVSIMAELHKKGIVPTTEAVVDELEDDENLIKHLRRRMDVVVERDETYLLSTLREEYNRKLIYMTCTEGLRAIRTDPVMDVAAQIQAGLMGLSVETPMLDSTQATISAMKYLEGIYSGSTQAYWKTNIEELDKVLGMTPRMITMVAAQQKTGKTRFLVNRIMELLKRQPYLTVRWWSLEMHSDQMFILLISWLTGIDSRIITGKTRMPTAEEMIVIRKAAEMIKAMPITWLGVQKKPTMEDIRRDTDKYGPNLVVIDNLGGLRNDKGLQDITFENNNALALVDMRDNTDAHIIPVHHLTKESMGHFNKENQYEPQVRHLRGTNKWADSVDTMVLLHRISMFKDLEDKLGPELWAACQNKIYVKVPLGRDGPQDDIVLTCDLGTSRFWKE